MKLQIDKNNQVFNVCILINNYVPAVRLDNSFQQMGHLVPDRDSATGYNRFGLDFGAARQQRKRGRRQNTTLWRPFDLTMHCRDYCKQNCCLKSDLRG